MVKINYHSEFQQCSYFILPQGTDNLDLMIDVNEFASKRNAILRAVLMKFLKIYNRRCLSAL